MLPDVEVDVITELWPVEALQEFDVMLFLTRCTSDLSASLQVSTSCCRWMLTVVKRQCKDVLICDEVSAKPDATKFLMLIPEA